MVSFKNILGKGKTKYEHPGFKTLQQIITMTSRRLEEVEGLRWGVHEEGQVTQELVEKYKNTIKAWKVFAKLGVFSRQNPVQNEIIKIFDPYRQHEINENVKTLKEMEKNLELLSNYLSAILNQLRHYEKNFDFSQNTG